MYQVISFIVFFSVVGTIFTILLNLRKKKKLITKKMNQAFPESWSVLLEKHVLFYSNLNASDKINFEKRVQRFIATKSIEGIKTSIDDSIRLMVASSAVIPTFAFPNYTYPYVHSILIYPGSFNSKFETKLSGAPDRNILGMVGGNPQDGTVILSKPDLVMAFDGSPHKENVGIHEFIHLLDKEDGEIDGIPKILIDHSFVGPWLQEIKNEIKRIEKGDSDINPYAITNNAEFLAVVGEYFFNHPEKFERRHPELYRFLDGIFNRTPSNQE